jgi:hypothetical protein
VTVTPDRRAAFDKVDFRLMKLQNGEMVLWLNNMIQINTRVGRGPAERAIDEGDHARSGTSISQRRTIVSWFSHLLVVSQCCLEAILQLSPNGGVDPVHDAFIELREFASFAI